MYRHSDGNRSQSGDSDGDRRKDATREQRSSQGHTGLEDCGTGMGKCWRSVFFLVYVSDAAN